jgi:hypothetical protein
LTGPETALLPIALLGWGRVLAARGETRSLFRIGAESIGVHTVVSTLVSVGLVAAGVFRPSLAQSLATVLPLVLLLRPRRDRPEFRALSLITRRELIVVVALVTVSPIALPRMENLRITDDADVYSNRAIHHLYTGSLVGTIPIRDRLRGDLLRQFDRDNLYHPTSASGHYLPGTYLTHRSQFVFHGLPGWPMLMAQWAGLFGLPRMFDSALFAFLMAVTFFGFLLEKIGLRTVTFTVTVLIFASSPLLLFFSKYTTSEAFVLFLFLLVVYFLTQDDAQDALLALLGLLLIVVTHISTLLYSPLLLLVALEAYRSGNRKLACFSVAGFGVLLVGLPLGWYLSPVYTENIYRDVFGRLGLGNAPWRGLILAGAAYSAGLLLGGVALRRGRGPEAVERPPSLRSPGERRTIQIAIRVLILTIVAWIVYRGYQLGWTDHFALDIPTDGAWVARRNYAGGGWGALLHLSILSMTMATSLVGLPIVLWAAFWRGGWVCDVSRRGFLLAGTLLSVAIYTFVLVDTPTNYYASRYFIPVLVPSALLLLGELMEGMGWRSAGIGAVALLGIAFNLRSDRILYLYPARNDQMRFVRDVVRRVGEERVLFVRNVEENDPEALLTLGLPLGSAWDIELVNVVGTADMPVDRLIARYADALGLDDAAVLSKTPPGDGRAFEAIVLRRRRLKRHILYPRERRQWRERYCLYNVAFRQRDAPADTIVQAQDLGPGGTGR